jgi:molybdopterin converting factor small subunit
MDVLVRLHATLRRPTANGYQNRIAVTLNDKATVSTLLREIGLEANGEHVMVLIGSRRVWMDEQLQPGDEVHLFPPISGGC